MPEFLRPRALALVLALAASTFACATQRGGSPTLIGSEEEFSAGLRAHVAGLVADMDDNDRGLLAECLTQVGAGDRSYAQVMERLVCYPSLRPFRARIGRYLNDHTRRGVARSTSEEWLIGDVVLEAVREELRDEPA